MLDNSFLHFVEKFYSLLIKLGSNLQSVFLFYMRITWGHQLFFIGLRKLKTIPEVTQFFSTLNIPFPELHAYLVGGLEALCGFLLFVGFASRMAAVPLIIILIAALSTAHSAELSNFRFLMEPMKLVHQAPYPFLITSLIVFVFGPGRISVDAWLKRWVNKQPRY
jgi:putative oxidoreductase